MTECCGIEKYFSSLHALHLFSKYINKINIYSVSYHPEENRISLLESILLEFIGTLLCLFLLGLLEEFCPLVERLGFDENFVDISEIVEKRLTQLQQSGCSRVCVSGHVYNNQGEYNDLHPEKYNICDI